MSEGIKALAKKVQSHGRGPDTVLAHIMPEEAAMLKRMGGAGTINPKTGLLEFVNPGDIAGGGFGSGNVGGGSSIGSGSVSPGLSGFGGGSSSPGGVDSAGNTNPSVGGGGGGGSYTGGGGGGGSLAAGRAADLASVAGYTGRRGTGGGGILTAATPSVTSTGGADFVPTSNAGSSFGVPTIVSNVMRGASNLMSTVGGYIPSMSSITSMLTPQAPAPLVDASGNQYTVDMWGNKNITVPATVPGGTWSTNLPNTPTTLAESGPTITAAGPNQVSYPGPTSSTTVMYDYTPPVTAADIAAKDKAAQVALAAESQLRDAFGPIFPSSAAQVAGGSGSYMSNLPSPQPQVEGGSGSYMSGAPVPAPTPVTSFDLGPSEAQISGGSGNYMAYAPGIASLPVPEAQVAGGSGNYMTQIPVSQAAPQTAPTPVFGTPTIMSPSTLGAGLETLMGTVPSGVYTFPQDVPSMAFKQVTPTTNIGPDAVPSSFRVNIPSFLDTVKQNTMGAGFLSQPSLYGRVVEALPEKGIQFTPGAIDPATGIPKTGTAVYNGAALGPDATPDQIAAAKQAYDNFMATYAGSLTPRTTTAGTFTGGQGTGAMFDVSGFGGTQPVSIADLPMSAPAPDMPVTAMNVEPIVATSLEDTFAMLSGTRPAVSMPNVAQATPSMIDYSQQQITRPTVVGGTPLYADATTFSGPKGAVPMTDAARWAGGGVFNNIETLNGLPPGYLGKVYGLESSFGKNLSSKLSTATGPFGFTQGTAKAFGLMDGGVDYRNDLVRSAAATGALAAQNANVLEGVLGRPPSAGELYLAHQQGAAGAAELLRNPNMSALDALTNANNGNRDLALQALVNNGGNVNMTAAQFAGMWINKAEKAPTGPKGQANTQVAQSYVPTKAPAAVPQQVVTPAEVAANPDLTLSYLDNAFNDVSQSMSSQQTPRAVTRSTSSRGSGATPTAPEAPVTPPTADVVTPTTGMVLTKQVYTPSGLVQTLSPAYS